MFSHISLGTSDLARAAQFYDAALLPLGFFRVWSDERAIGYGKEGEEDRFTLFDESEACVPLAAGPGFHLAFEAPDRNAVDNFHRHAIDAGGRCDGAPGPRPQYGKTYYAAFVVDPDGYRLEAVYQYANHAIR